MKNTREPSALAIRKCTSSAASSAQASLTPCAVLIMIVFPLFVSRMYRRVT